MSVDWNPQLEVDQNNYLVSPKGIYFDALTSLSYSYSIYAVEDTARNSSRVYKTDFSSFEVLLAMSFNINYNLKGFSNHLENYYLEKNKNEIKKIVNEVDKIVSSQSQNQDDMHKDKFLFYNLLREYIPNFYTDMGSHREQYLGPFYDLDKMESCFLLGLGRGLFLFYENFNNSYEFNKKDFFEKNVIKLLCLFFWFVDEYWRGFPDLSRELKLLLSSEGIKLLEAFAVMRENNFPNPIEVDQLVKNFTSLRFDSLYPNPWQF